MRIFTVLILTAILALPLSSYAAKELSGGQAANKALGVHPGKLISVRSKKDKKGRYYLIKILKKDGRVKSVKVNAKTGKVS